MVNDSIVIKKGVELEIEVQSLAYGGMGLAKVDDFVVFVKNGIPGQRVLVLIYKKKKGFAEARIIKVLEQSPLATEARCDHYWICSKLQTLSYEEQLKEKEKQVVDAFQRIGGFTDFIINGVRSAKNKYNYRNKMEFTFSPHRWILESEPEGVDSSFALGLHIPGRYDKILDIDTCHIQPDIGNKILGIAREVCLKNLDLKPYDPKTNIGFLRHLMLRFGVKTNQLMVNIVTAYDDINKLSPLIDALLKEVPEITSMVNNVNTRKADVAFGEFENLIFGNSFIEEKIGNLKFEISANSFFQTNTYQGKVLYDEVLKIAGLNGDEIVYDLYCGTGSIALYLASKAKEVYGFEVIRSSLENAEKNSLINGIDNVHFLKANLDTFFKSGQLPRRIPKPNVIIVDPPRAGMHPDMSGYLHKLKAEKIIYVSCNPTTQARDVKILNDNDYKIKNSVMVDMFPHTPHIETVMLLSK